MPSIDLKIDLNSDPLNNLDEKVIGAAVTAALNSAVKEFTNQIQEGFNKESVPGGGSWTPLSPAYAKLKAKLAGGKPILQLTGAMKESATNPQVQLSGGGTDQSVTLTASDPKSGIHEFGGGKVPARPFFTVEGQAADAVLAAADEGFIKGLKI